MLELFEEVKDEQYVWKGFFSANNIPCKTGSVQTYTLEGIKVEKLLATGFGLNLKNEETLLTQCKNTRIFTREIELALLSEDREMYLYTQKNGEPVNINSLGIVNKYIFISEHEVVSPVFIRDGDTYTDDFFMTLKTYVLNHKSNACGFNFEFTDKIFTMSKNDEVLMKMTGTDISYTYPFVIYVLRKLAETQPLCGFESGIEVKRVRKLTENERHL